MKKDKIIGIRISEELYEEYSKLVKDAQVSFSDFVRKTMDKSFNEYKRYQTDKPNMDLPDDVYAYTHAKLAIDEECIICKNRLPKDTQAVLGFTQDNSKPKIYCIYCKQI